MKEYKEYIKIYGDNIVAYDDDGSVLDRGSITKIDIEKQIVYYGNNSYLDFDYDRDKLYFKKSDGTCFNKVSK